MKNIVLTGMPGSGKSTIARGLINKLAGFKLVEIDDEIEKSEGLTIQNIFKKKGENYFRKKESEIINDFCLHNSLIISLGGGAFENKENQINLKKSGLVFFLNCSIETVYNRIKDETQRPLLNNEYPKEKLMELYNERIKNFNCSDFTIDANREKDAIINDIIRIYNARTKN